jgi:hypothetical protein
MEEFIEYLIKQKDMQLRSARDVSYRYKRINNMLDIDINENPEEILTNIENSSEFAVLSPFVKSQLRRAVFLYDEYQESKK